MKTLVCFFSFHNNKHGTKFDKNKEKKLNKKTIIILKTITKLTLKMLLKVVLTKQTSIKMLDSCYCLNSRRKNY